MDNLSPTHPDVAPVLHLLDKCEVCGGNGTLKQLTGIRKVLCPSCIGRGKALHPDRVVGALRRQFFRAHGFTPLEMPCAWDESRGELDFSAHENWRSGNEVGRALAYCRAARAVLEASA